MRWRLTIYIISALFCWALPAAADTINPGEVVIVGNGTQGSYTGVLSYVVNSPTSATVTVALTNTSTLATGGYLSAFFLNIPGNQVTGISLAANSNGFHLFGAPLTSPFGSFNLGAGSFFGTRGGIGLQPGISPGSSGTFTFTLTGSGLNTLAVPDYFEAFSSQEGTGIGSVIFAARFSGSGSNQLVTGEQPISGVPIPPTALLLGSGLLGIITLGVRRRKR